MTKAEHGNRYETGPQVSVVVADLSAAWSGGVFAGDPLLVGWAQKVAEARAVVRAFGLEIICDESTPLGALGAMASWSPGRCLVTQAPPEVLDMLVDGHVPGR